MSFGQGSRPFQKASLPGMLINTAGSEGRGCLAFYCAVCVFPWLCFFFLLPFIPLLCENAFSGKPNVWFCSELSESFRLSCGKVTATKGEMSRFPELVNSVRLRRTKCAPQDECAGLWSGRASSQYSPRLGGCSFPCAPLCRTTHTCTQAEVRARVL